MSQAKLAAAQELIRERRFDEARALLRTMPDDEQIQALLAKLPSQRRFPIGWLLLVIVVFVAGIAIGFTLKPAPTPAVVIAPTTTPLMTTPPPLTLDSDVQTALEAASEASATPAATTTSTAAPSATPRTAVTNTATPNLAATQTELISRQTQTVLEMTSAVLQENLTLTAYSVVPSATAAPPTIAPLIFQGTKAQVLGPVNIPAGLYRARVTTTGSFIATLQTMQGECGSGTYGTLQPLLFNLLDGQANGAETVLQSNGCSVIIQVSNVTAPWELQFTQIG